LGTIITLVSDPLEKLSQIDKIFQDLKEKDVILVFFLLAPLCPCGSRTAFYWRGIYLR
jgi:hypothetical protein